MDRGTRRIFRRSRPKILVSQAKAAPGLARARPIAFVLFKLFTKMADNLGIAGDGSSRSASQVKPDGQSGLRVPSTAAHSRRPNTDVGDDDGFGHTTPQQGASSSGGSAGASADGPTPTAAGRSRPPLRWPDPLGLGKLGEVGGILLEFEFKTEANLAYMWETESEMEEELREALLKLSPSPADYELPGMLAPAIARWRRARSLAMANVSAREEELRDHIRFGGAPTRKCFGRTVPDGPIGRQGPRVVKFGARHEETVNAWVAASGITKAKDHKDHMSVILSIYTGVLVRWGLAPSGWT